MQRKILAATFAAALLFAGAACSSDDSGGGGDLQGQIAEQITADDPSMSEDDANCLAGAMIDVFGEDTMQEALDTDGASMDNLDSEDPEKALELVNKMSECNPELLGGLGEGE